MAVKKIIQNAFEQVVETGKDIAKSSAQQVKETFSPWDMIKNSFNTGETAESNQQQQLNKMKELQGKGAGHTPLNYEHLQQKYANQDKAKADALKQRLFQMIKQQDERSLMQGKQEKAEKERMEAYQESENKRRQQEQQRAQAQSAAPQGKERQSILGKKKKRKGTDVQPIEAKPNSSKQ